MGREARRALLVLVAIFVATRIGRVATIDDVSWFWPPAAVVALTILTERRWDLRSALRVGALLLAGRALSFVPEVLAGDPGWWRPIATGVPVTTAYVAIGSVVRATSRRFGRGGLPEMAAFLLLLGLVAPVAAGLGSSAVRTALGLGPMDLARSLKFALGDGLAVVAIAPLWMSVLRERHRELELAHVVGIVVLGALVVAAVTGGVTGLLTGTQAALLVVAPMLVAASVVGRLGTGVVALLGGVCLWVLAARRPDVDVLLDLKALYLASAVIAHALAAAMQVTGARLAGGASLERLIAVPALGERTVPTIDALHERLGSLLRRARLVVVVFVVARLVAQPDLLVSSVPAWLLLAVPVGGLLAANAWSMLASRAGVHDLRQRRVEAMLDLTTVTSMFLLLGDPTRDDRLSLGLVLVAVVVALRLPVREALAGTLLAHVVAIVLQLEGRLTPGIVLARAGEVAIGAVLLTLVVLLVGWAMAVLDGYRRRAVAVADEVAEAQASLATKQALLEHDRDVLAEQADQLRAALAERDAAMAELERTRDAMEDFATIAAHDLKAPMASAMMMAGGIADGAFTAEQRAHFAGRIGANLRRSTALVDRLLEHARSQTVRLDPTVVDTGVLLREVVADQASAVEACGAEVVVPDFLPAVNGDRVLLHQALSNLVSNALRYASADGHRPTLEVVARHHADGLALTVQDDGPGFRPEQLDEDGRVDPERRTTGGEGLGLGMRTVARIVRRHGGLVRAHARDDGRPGAAVTMLLPLAPVRDATVLLVSPDAPTRRVLSAPIVADAGGAQVLRADGVDLARRLLAEREPVLAVVDVARLDDAALELLSLVRRRGTALHVLARDDQASLAEAHGATRWGPDDAVSAGRAVAGWLRGHVLAGLDGLVATAAGSAARDDVVRDAGVHEPA